MKNGDKTAGTITYKDGADAFVHLGFTKREVIAAMAMQATNMEEYALRYGNKWAVEVAKDSVQMADALLYALETIPIPESK